MKRAASSGDMDELDKSCRRKPRVLSGDLTDLIDRPTPSPVKVVNREPSLKCIEEDKAVQQRLGLRSQLLRRDHDGSRGTAMTSSTCTLESMPSLSALSISGMVNAGELDLLEVVKKSPPRSVTFGTNEIREYPRALGDNPAVTSGPPLTIEWDHDPQALVVVQVDAYEKSKPFRRNKTQMLVPHMMREDWLRNAGYSRSDIDEAVKEVDAVKESRRRSARGANAGRFKALKDILRLGIKRRERDPVLPHCFIR